MQNEEPRTKRTAAGIESRNVLYIYIYICVYIYIYIGICYEFEYRLYRCFHRRKRAEFSSPKFTTTNKNNWKRFPLRVDDFKNAEVRNAGSSMIRPRIYGRDNTVNKVSLRIRGDKIARISGEIFADFQLRASAIINFPTGNLADLAVYR